jgi:hypothetical protein
MRFHRSTREAFPCERFPAVFGPFKPPLWERLAGVILAAAMAISFALILVHHLAR